MLYNNKDNFVHRYCAYLLSFILGGVVLKKKKRGTFFKLTFVLAVFLFVCLFYKGYSALNECNKQKEQLNDQIAQEERYSKELDKTLKEYESDEYVEKYARTLGLVKPNEKVYRNYNDK